MIDMEKIMGNRYAQGGMQWYQQPLTPDVLRGPYEGDVPWEPGNKQRDPSAGTTPKVDISDRGGWQGNYSYNAPGWIQPQTPTTTGFNYPPEWNQASNVYGYYSGGVPTTQGAWWKAMQPVVQRSIEDQAKQAAEQAGLGGTRWSTPLQRNITDIAGREMAGLGAQWTDRELQAREAAANRALQAAGGLQSVGGQFLQAPQDWALRMYGMGTGMQGLYQGALGRQYQDFLRQTPESSPWTQQALGYASIAPQMVPTQYQPSGTSQAMGMFGSLLPLLGLLSSARFKKNIEEVSTDKEDIMYEAMINTPIKMYQYKHEGDTDTKHLGLITEESPEEITLLNKNAIGIVEYIGALHATVKTMARKIKKLEEG